MAARHRSSWADLHPELLGLVLGRLPSLADRVRLGAVCRPRRRVARQEPLPPPLSWLILLDGTFLSIPGGEIHCMPVAEDAYLRVCVGNWLFLTRCSVPVPEDSSLQGSMGNWLFPKPLHGELLALMNPFSKHVVLPNEANVCPGDSMFFKLVPLSSTTEVSPDSLFVVLITTRSVESVISICRPSAATAFRMPEYILDVAFFDGKLYALSRKKLFAFEVDLSYKGKPRIPSFIECVADAIEDAGPIQRSIAESTCVKTKNSCTLSFEVFEVDLTTNSRHKWTRVNTLGDQALFVGIHSKSLPASRCGAQDQFYPPKRYQTTESRQLTFQ
ncbi:uncharacterized protein [Miscanthus floridulus]|uniref:uncharacterized protein n=1 Tax=Miscanthus floridulus TaxID=154761 RepID=UPI003459BD69